MIPRVPPGRPGDWVAALAWSAVAVSWLAAIFLSKLPRSLQGDDDNLYLYSTGLAVAHPSEVTRLNEDILTFLRDEGYGRHALFRWEQRQRYQSNYVLPSAVLYGVSRMVGPASYPAYTDYLHAALPLGFVTIYGLTLLVLGTGLAATRSPRVAASVAGAILLGVAIDAFIGYRAPYRLVIPGDPFATLMAAAGSLLSPNGALALFSHTPRNLVVVLMLLVFAWRIHGWYAASYWVVLGLGVVHQGLAGLALASLAGVDLILRPRELLRWSAGIPLVGGALLFLVRDRLLFMVLDPGWAVGTAIVTLVGGGGLLRWRLARAGRRSLESAGPNHWSPQAAAAELGILLLQCGGCLAIAYLMAARTDQFTALYFWRELPGRLEAIVQPGLMLLAFHLVAWCATRGHRSGMLARTRSRGAALALSAILLAGAGLILGRRTRAGFPRLRTDLAKVEQSTARFGKGQPIRQQSFLQIQEGEAVLLRALSETVDRRNGALQALLSGGRAR